MYTGKKWIAGALTAAATGAAVIGISVSSASSGSSASATPGSSVKATALVAADAPTTTPIKHVVVLFDENISFDHYFGTYPNATNVDGTPFTALPNTPVPNNYVSHPDLLSANPNSAEPARLGPGQALTCDQNHGYTSEQSAFDDGLMDKFVQNTAGTGCTQTATPNSGSYGNSSTVMDYYDGNTVTALWNLAQHFTLNDNSYDTQFGPSSPGAINVVSGDTHGAVAEGGATTNVANGTLVGDAEPYFDECSNASTPLAGALPNGDPAPGGITAELTGQNIGDLLNTKGLTWGWFQGGFTPSSYSNGRPVCATAHTNVGGASEADYSEHHEPFQYYQSTSNPEHLAPSNVDQVGLSTADGGATGVNNQYDLSYFNQAVAAGDMPAVSYLKAPEYEDGHAGYSDPLDEQRFLVDEINTIEQSPDWSSTAIFIAYDDSDGWYDHQEGPIVRGSTDSQDTLNGVGVCGPADTVASDGSTQDRCGVGPRLPLLVISPWAKQNNIDDTFTEQASIPQFIEQNWGLGSVGGGSADQTAGTLDNAFDFSQPYGQAPAIIMSDSTGAITQVIPAPAPATTTTTTTTPTTTLTTVVPPVTTTTIAPTPTRAKVTFPKLTPSVKFAGHQLTLSLKTKGGSSGKVTVRARLYRGKKLVGNKAVTVRDHKGTLKVNLKTQPAGTYRLVLTLDLGGKTKVIKKTIRYSGTSTSAGRKTSKKKTTKKK